MNAGFLNLDTIEEEEPSVGLMPLIDVVFQLLVFFMLTSTFASPALELVLPQISHEAEPAEATAWQVELNAEGLLAVEGAPVDGEIEGALKRILSVDTERKNAALRADAAVPHGRVTEVLQALSSAGIEHVFFVYEEPAA